MRVVVRARTISGSAHVSRSSDRDLDLGICCGAAGLAHFSLAISGEPRRRKSHTRLRRGMGGLDVKETGNKKCSKMILIEGSEWEVVQTVTVI